MELEEIKQRLYAAKKLTHDAGTTLGDNPGNVRLAKAKAVMDIIEDLALEAAAYIVEVQIEKGEYRDE